MKETRPKGLSDAVWTPTLVPHLVRATGPYPIRRSNTPTNKGCVAAGMLADPASLARSRFYFMKLAYSRGPERYR